MPSADYIPGASTLVPGSNTTYAPITGAGNYNQLMPNTAQPGAGSIVCSQRLIDIITFESIVVTPGETIPKNFAKG